MKTKIRYFYPLIFASIAVIIMAISAQGVDWQSLLKQTMPAAERFSQISDVSGYKARNLTKAIFTAYNGNKQVGVVFYSAPNGYDGAIHTLVAIDMDGTIRKVNIFSQNETPSYVGPLNNGSYQRQFEGMTLSDKFVFLIGSRPSRRGEIQSITGATETSKPIALAVSEARKLFAEIYGNRS